MNAYKGRISGIVLLAATGCSLSAHAAFDQQTLQKKIEMLENKSGGKLGLTVVDTSDGTMYSWRGDEKFPLCSTSKVMVVAAILKKSESNTNLLAKKITINKSDMVNYNPITSKYIDSSMTITELSKAALQYSDNAAMNKLLSYLGGPRYATQFARTIGDKAYRLDRNEPVLIPPSRVIAVTQPPLQQWLKLSTNLFLGTR